MARRQLLSNEAWAARLAPVVDDRDVIRHYTLSEDDFDVIMRKRLDASRLGYALARLSQLGHLSSNFQVFYVENASRYKGR
jgi:hypothetical protein